MAERNYQAGRRKKEVRAVNGALVSVPVTLKPLEEGILQIAFQRKKEGEEEFYGYNMAKDLRTSGEQKLSGNGTIYKALKRMVGWGLLESKPEELSMAQEHYGSLRILYSLTPAGISRIRDVDGNADPHLSRQKFISYISSP